MDDDEDFDQVLRGLADALAEPVSQPSVQVPDALDVAAIRRRTAGSSTRPSPRRCGTGSRVTAHRRG